MELSKKRVDGNIPRLQVFLCYKIILIDFMISLMYYVSLYW